MRAILYCVVAVTLVVATHVGATECAEPHRERLELTLESVLRDGVPVDGGEHGRIGDRGTVEVWYPSSDINFGFRWGSLEATRAR